MTRKAFAKFFFLFFFSIAFTVGVEQQLPQPTVNCQTIANTKYLWLTGNSDDRISLFFLHNKWYLVWDCKNSNKASLKLPTEDELPPGLSNLEQITSASTSRPAIILSFSTTLPLVPVAVHDKTGWGIHLVEERLLSTATPNQPMVFEERKLGEMFISSKDPPNPITIILPNDEEFFVMPTLNADGGLDAKESDYLNVVETNQGICLQILCDNLTFEHNSEGLIGRPTFSPLMYSIKYDEGLVPNVPDKTFYSKVSVDLSYLQAILSELANIDKTHKNYPLLKLRQAWIQIIIGEGDSAKETLQLLATERPDIIKHYYFLFLYGCAKSLVEEFHDSLEIFNQLPNTAEVALWSDFARSQLDEREPFDESIVEILKKYPVVLKDQLLQNLIPYLFKTEQFSLFQAIRARIAPEEKVTYTISEFYDALYLFLYKNKEEGYKAFKRIFSLGINYPLPNQYKTAAQFETYLYENPDAPLEETIKELSLLRMQARDTNFEIPIAFKLIGYLEKASDYPQIIDVLHDLISRFQSQSLAIQLRQKMQQFLFKLFTQETSKISAVKKIAIFKKYRKNIDTLSSFEKIALIIVGCYEQLDLLEQAASLMTELLEHTRDPEKHTEYLLKIGKLYLRNHQPDKMLELAKNLNLNTSPKNKPLLYKMLAKAYIQKNDYPAAMHYLKDAPTKENLRLIADLYIAEENYPQIIAILKDYIKMLGHDKKDARQREIALVQLASVYRIQQNFDELKYIHEHNQLFMKGRKRERIFAMLCRQRADQLQNAEQVLAYVEDTNVLQEILKRDNEIYGDFSYPDIEIAPDIP